MGLGKNYAGQDCSLARALELIGERWTFLVIRDALYGVRRFGDFLAHLDLPRAVLAQRLQTLVDAGIMERRRYQDTPPRDEYVLTEMGRDLWAPMFTLASWGERHLTANGPRRLYFHVACGTRLVGTTICDTCRTPVPLEEVEIRPGPGASCQRQDPVSRALREPHRMLDPMP
ncbi:helix-turn-helix domain-containing protein [Thermopolyspora sp. NPDC052614]|uniref:winged helix-turn-helix transcriptional regulator n=1 Tax=Thermopolyspora sp. NPDC052614 TaxID=3155682 RepID=UPI00341432D6